MSSWPAPAIDSSALPFVRLPRRWFIGLACGAALAVAFNRGSGAGAVPPVISRNAWGTGLEPRAPMDVEAAGDVRFLLVHHTAGTNDYSEGEVPRILRAIYEFHTREKGWPDVAYNFFVDRYGRIWEGRTGSIDKPVKGDATGGSQGFAILCCFIGDHSGVAPTEEAKDAMTQLLAWLAARYAIDTRPGATTEFVSRGSNRWPAGRSVTTATIAGHRDMSRTACPGDAAYDIVTRDLPGLVTAARMRSVPATSMNAAPSSSTSLPSTSVPQSMRRTDGGPSGRTPKATPVATGVAGTPARVDGGRDPMLPLASGLSAVLIGAATATAIAVRRLFDRRSNGMR